MTNQDMPNRAEIEELLPWHAAGTLDPSEAEQVEAAMARDPELMRRFMLAREEMTETVDLNEALGHPSPQVMTRLMAAIDAEGSRNQMRTLGFANRIGMFFASLTPRQLAFSAAAAALAIVLQAGLIGAIVVGENNQATYQTASAEGPGAEAPGAGKASDAFVHFAANASAGEVSKVLQANGLRIVDGPRPGGLYRVRIAALEKNSSVVTRGVDLGPSPEAYRAEVLKRLQATGIVQFAVPAH